MVCKILNTIGKEYSREAMVILEQLGKVDCLDLSQDELNKKIGEYEVLLVGLGLNIDKEAIRRGKHLKIIATVTTGLDHIDIKEAKERGVGILSLKGETKFLENIKGTAEISFALMIALVCKIFFAFENVKEYQWHRGRFKRNDLCGQTLGVVGLGRLGKMMAGYAKSFGMRVIAFDPYIDNAVFDEVGCANVNFEILLRKSDIISIHIPLNEETENMFNLFAFEQMKKSAYLVNTSRGKVVDEKCLLKALNDKEIAGYGTDVLADELDFKKNFIDHHLVEYSKKNNNLIILPHIGGVSYQSRKLTDIFIAKKIVKFLMKIYHMSGLKPKEIYQKLTKDVFLVAEIGKNFIQKEKRVTAQEYLDNAKKLIKEAKLAGASAVKFQTHNVEDEQLNAKIISPHFTGKDRYSWVKFNTEITPFSFWQGNKKILRRIKYYFFLNTMSRGAAKTLEKLGIDLWKVGSGDILDFVMLDYIAKTGKPIIISSG